MTTHTKVTPDYVRERVRTLAESHDDYEIAHGMEDDLRAEVLRAIADGSCDDPAELAAEVLKTSLIDFPRYCA